MASGVAGPLGAASSAAALRTGGATMSKEALERAGSDKVARDRVDLGELVLGAAQGEADLSRAALGELVLDCGILDGAALDGVTPGKAALARAGRDGVILGDVAVAAALTGEGLDGVGPDDAGLDGVVLVGVAGATAAPRVGLGTLATWSSEAGGCTFFGVATGSSASPVVRFAAVVART